MSPNIFLGGSATFAKEQSDQVGKGCGRGCPSPTVGTFFIFQLENVQSGTYLDHVDGDFDFDSTCTIWESMLRFKRPGKGYIFHEFGKNRTMMVVDVYSWFGV